MNRQPPHRDAPTTPPARAVSPHRFAPTAPPAYRFAATAPPAPTARR